LLRQQRWPKRGHGEAEPDDCEPEFSEKPSKLRQSSTAGPFRLHD
jgi:hypothetical protein